MDSLMLIALPRVLHVLGVILWIGGVALVATVVLPALRAGEDVHSAYNYYQQVVRRFVWQARVTTLIVGLSGFHMLGVMRAWDRYLNPSFWWVWAMTLVWVIFTVILFVLQPLGNRRRGNSIPDDPKAALSSIHRMHWGLLALSLLTVAGAVAGAHGWYWF